MEVYLLLVNVEQIKKYRGHYPLLYLVGASVLRKSTFLECGKFDEGMFVGFEDNDFSITVFKKGYKVATIGILGLIHDHKKPENQNDLEYEKQRFSNVRLLKSARYFEKKHNFKIWNEVTENWLKEKEKELGITSNEEIKENEIVKKKLAVVIKNLNSKTQEMVKNFNDNIKDICDIKIIPFEDINNNIVNLIFAIQNVDKIYIMDEDILDNLDEKQLDDYLEKYYLNKDEFLNRYVNDLEIIVRRKEESKENKENDKSFFDVKVENIKNDDDIRKIIEKY